MREFVTPLDERRAADWLVAALRGDTTRQAELAAGPIKLSALYGALTWAWPVTWLVDPDAAADKLDGVAAVASSGVHRSAARYAAASVRLGDTPAEADQNPDPGALVAVFAAAFDDPPADVLARATDHAFLMWQATADALDDDDG